MQARQLTPQAEQNADWIQNVYWTLGIGYVLSLPTALYLLLSRPNTENSPTSGLRQPLLEAVESEVKIRRKDFLHEQVVINLHLQEQPQQVGWTRRQLRIDGQPDASLDPAKPLIEVFDQDNIKGKLLILGNPGAGKTTQLLELAMDLITRAQKDENAPIPVIFELSAWEKDKPIEEWLAVELKAKYNLPKEVSFKWLETDKLLPLLDGLDELRELKDKCIEAINHFQEAYKPHSLVVCSRLKDYESCKTQLDLKGAVCLQPLSQRQIQDYLEQVGKPELWNSNPGGR